MLGLEPTLPIKQGKLRSNYKKKSNKTEVVAANLKFYDGNYSIDFEDKKSGSSAILTNMLGDITLVMISQESLDLSSGDLVDFIDLGAL
jgi:molybdopterin molybdotransferase